MKKRRSPRRSKRGYIMIPARRNPGGRITPVKNVSAGFHDEDGIFHPIRASFDYSRSRAGEPPKKKKAKKKK